MIELMLVGISFLGLFVGSFLNVIVDRIQNEENFLTGRSHCDFCKHTLSALDLIPVLSYIFLHRKCRYCHKKLSGWYPVTEVVTGVLFGLVGYLYGMSSLPLLCFVLFVVCVGIIIFFSDLKYGIIPDVIVLPAMGIVFLYHLFFHTSSLPSFLGAGIGAGAFFLLIYFLTKGKGMGFGDVKFTFLMGLILGFPFIVVSLYIAFVTGAAVAIFLIVLKRKKFHGDTMTFGEFLVLGMFVSLFWGDLILKHFQLT